MIKKSIIFFTLSAMLFLCSCGQGISTNEAKEYADMFYGYVEEEDYVAAASLFHPERGTTGEFMSEYFLNVEEKTGVDFSEGIKVKYNGFSSSLYDSEVGGASLELKGELVVSSVTFDLILDFAKKDDAFGIYNFQLDMQD